MSDVSYTTTAAILLPDGTEFYKLSRETRDRLKDAIACTFRPRSGSGRGCYDTAVMTANGERRCYRHASIDERTERQRAASYGRPPRFETFPYDARIAGAQVVDAIRAENRQRRQAEVAAKVAESARFILGHVAFLEDDQRSFLTGLAKDAESPVWTDILVR